MPTFRHKDAWAEERTAPTTASEPEPAAPQRAVMSAPQRTVMPTPERKPADVPEREVLIVASKLKDYIQKKSGMSTSAAVMDILSDKVRQHADQAIKNAQNAGRKTVLDRDFT